jgi:peptidoglycan/LPS O-acetylase OafA/YrhL
MKPASSALLDRGTGTRPAPGLFGRLRTTSNDLLHLDALRFFASCAIVLHHSKEFYFSAENRPFILQQTAGLALFVDLFFVISGFVIAYVYGARLVDAGSYATFLQRRVGRLGPLHWLTLVVSIALWALLLALGLAANHPPSFRPACIAETALFLHAIVDCGGRAFNEVSWSISAEMAMYAIFPLLALLARANPLRLVLVGALVWIGLAASITTRDATSSVHAWEALYAPLRALPSFALGVALFYGRDAVARLPQARLILTLAAAFLVVGIALALPAAVLILDIYVLVTAAVAADLQRKTSSLVTWVAPLGQLTYSIYMIHYLTIFAIMNLFADKFLHLAGATMLVAGIGCYGAILAMSYGSYLWIETPARRFIDRLDPRLTARKR